MNKHVRIIEREAREIARPLGVEVTVDAARGGHPHLIFTGPKGGKRHWALPCSPRDADQVIHWGRKKLARYIKEVASHA